MKKTIALLCTAAMLLSLSACAGKVTDYSNATITGKVTAISGSSVTMQLGTLTEAAGGTGQTPPDAPSGGSADNTDQNTANDSTSSTTAGSNSNTGSTTSGQSSSKKSRPSKPGSNASGGSSSDTNTDSSGSKKSRPSQSGTQATGTTASSASGNAQASSAADNTAAGSAQTPPDKPDGDNAGGGQTPPDGAPGGTSVSFTAGSNTATVDLSNAVITENANTIAVSDIEKDDILTITFDDNNTAATVKVVDTSTGNGQAGGAPGGSGNNAGGESSGTVDQGSSANTISENSTVSGKSYSSTGDDENALRVDSATVTLDGVTVNKSAGASSNAENGDFYGVNAALLATNGANVTIKNANIQSAAQNGNGVFSYGSGTTVNIADSKITTTADNSGGIQTTGGGTTNASNLTVNTSGNSAAAIRSDRGGGTVNVTGGSYTSNGYNSPAVYSTAAITVKNATLTANNSEALVIEGKNSIALENCTVTGNMSDTKGSSSSENVHNVMIYQSMSGDAAVGTSSFSMTGGKLTANNGDMFYITNTACTLTLSGVDIVNKDSDAYLMNICGNSAARGWGTAGQNGAQVTFTADGQTLSGKIVVDTISTLNMTLKGNSTFTGSINIVDNAAGGNAVANNAVVTVESGSTWSLTGDCTITSLTNNGTIQFNGHTITLADGTVLK